MLKFKKIYLLVLAFCLSTGVFAQKDKQAREVLDKTAAAMKNAGGIVLYSVVHPTVHYC